MTLCLDMQVWPHLAAETRVDPILGGLNSNYLWGRAQPEHVREAG